jgi:FkbM family methyltransferase
MTPAQRWLRPLCRHLPPSFAYRLYYRFIAGAQGSPDRFEGARAMVGNARLSSSMEDVVDLLFAYHGCSEWLGMTLCRLLTRPGQVIFEIGANLGTDTLNMAGIVGAAGRVVSVEPSAACFAKLRARVEENRLAQVTVLNTAVAETVGRFALEPGPNTNSGMAYLGALAPDLEKEAVETTTIGALAQAHGAPHFIWMDIEGFELRALRGGSSVLRQARPFVYTEVDRGHLERAGDSLDAFQAFVKDHDYQAVDPTSWRLPLLTNGHAAPGYYHANWLLVPTEKLDTLAQVRVKYLAARLLPRL